MLYEDPIKLKLIILSSTMYVNKTFFRNVRIRPIRYSLRVVLPRIPIDERCLSHEIISI